MLGCAIFAGAALAAPTSDPQALSPGMNVSQTELLAPAFENAAVRPSHLCEVENFRFSLRKVSEMLPGVLEEVGGEHRVVEHYQSIGAGSRQDPSYCLAKPDKAAGWTMSTRKHGMIMNFGEGTTATRFLNCVMEGLGYRTNHNDMHLEHCSPDCTARWDTYDYISDSPVPKYVSELMATHPAHEGAAAYFLSLRDPKEWAKSRISHHFPEAKQWDQQSICGDAFNKLTNTKLVPLHKLVYDSFAHCLATSHRFGSSTANLFMFNLFRYKSEHEGNKHFSKELHAFLNTDNHHGAVPKHTLTHEKIHKTVVHCAAESSYWSED